MKKIPAEYLFTLLVVGCLTVSAGLIVLYWAVIYVSFIFCMLWLIKQI